jgi:hypothetical protein
MTQQFKAHEGDVGNQEDFNGEDMEDEESSYQRSPIGEEQLL